MRDQEYFCDEQRAGPYRIWHHEHFFEASGGKSTRMRDLVTYALPFGPAGKIAVPLVRSKLRSIFEYRREAVVRIFG